MRKLDLIDPNFTGATLGTTVTGKSILASGMRRLSAQAIAVGFATGGGTLQLQGSNDLLPPLDNPNDYDAWCTAAGFTQSWAPIAQVTITAAGVSMIDDFEIGYSWIRAVFTAGGTAPAGGSTLQVNLHLMSQV